MILNTKYQTTILIMVVNYKWLFVEVLQVCSGSSEIPIYFEVEVCLQIGRTFV